VQRAGINQSGGGMENTESRENAALRLRCMAAWAMVALVTACGAHRHRHPGSASVQRLLVQRVPQDGPFNGCVPAAEITVGGAAAEHVLQLDAATWQVPARCTAAERALHLGKTLKPSLRHTPVARNGDRSRWKRFRWAAAACAPPASAWAP
jgi:hypothetical protein